MRRLLTTLLSVVLVVGIIVGYGIWLFQYTEVPAVTILASRDAELGLPVYAQFTVTQTVTLPEAVEITRLVIPAYVTGANYPVAVTLRRNGSVVKEWTYSLDQIPLGENGTRELAFDISPPRLLDGMLEVTIAAPEFDHEHQDIAPRVFIETEDAAYSEGNYRIAQNEKKGDMSLQLFTRERNVTQKWRVWREQPAATASLFMLYTLLLILVGVLPQVLAGSSEHTTPDTNQQTS